MATPIFNPSADRFYVYAWYRDRACTKIFYVGKGTGRREDHWKDDLRLNKNPHLTRVIAKVCRKHGLVPTRRLHDNPTEAEALALELLLIAQIGKYPNGPLVNIHPGGRPNGMSPEQARKHSERMRGRPAPNKGKPMSAEQREKCKHTFLKPGDIPWNKGIPTPEEVRDKQRGVPKSLEARLRMSAAKKGKPPPNKGKPKPPHQIELERQRMLGTKRSDATRLKMSQSAKHWSRTPEGRATKSAAARARWDRVIDSQRSRRQPIL
jgi:hypothetical protein